jgi:hypothetical protein
MAQNDSSGIGSVYTPLDRTARSIRLIMISPGTDALIDCELYVFDLAHCPPFTALSYTWGPPSPTRDILLGGWRWTVRENLYLALTAIRRKLWNNSEKGAISDGGDIIDNSDGGDIINISDGGDYFIYDGESFGPDTGFQGDHWSYFWIDAISIQQSNDLEKNHQVGMMSDIYSQAELVLAWLGEERDGSALLLQHMKKMSQPFGLQMSQIRGPNIERARHAFFSRAYWRRVWVVQEMMLAKDLLFFVEISVVLSRNYGHTVDILVLLPRRLHGCAGVLKTLIGKACLN